MKKINYLKMAFFDHFGIVLRQFCLKAILEIKSVSTRTKIF